MPKSYEQRVVAFIDILGFKSIIEKTIEKNDIENMARIASVINAFKDIREIWNLDSGELKHYVKSSKRVTIFSDSIVVSCEANDEEEIMYTLLEIKWLVMTMLNHGLLCRGAITRGKLVHTNEYIFGPALIEAHLLESKAALYPRIILDRGVIDAEEFEKNKISNAGVRWKNIQFLLEQDSDGMYYIDYFRKAQHELNDPIYDFPAYIHNLGNLIRDGLKRSAGHNQVDLRIKYFWMRERYNQMVEQVTKKDACALLKSTGEPGLFDFYSKLRKIGQTRR